MEDWKGPEAWRPQAKLGSAAHDEVQGPGKSLHLSQAATSMSIKEKARPALSVSL